MPNLDKQGPVTGTGRGEGICTPKEKKIKKKDLDETTKSLLDGIQLNSTNPTLIGQQIEMMEFWERIRKEKERLCR